MSTFTGSLVIEEVVPGRRWRLAQPIRYEAGAKGSGKVITVPAGFETDGATIPAALRTMLAVWGSYGRAACLHDYLYSISRYGKLWTTDHYGADDIHPAYDASNIQYIGVNMEFIGSYAREWADAEFHRAMIACGTSRPLAWVIWAAVRLFGSRYFRRV